MEQVQTMNRTGRTILWDGNVGDFGGYYTESIQTHMITDILRGESVLYKEVSSKGATENAQRNKQRRKTDR